MPLDRDRITALERRAELPEGLPTQYGTFVTFDGFDEEGDPQYALTSGPVKEILRSPSDPNGVMVARRDTLCVARDDHSVWINVDGETEWEEIGGGGASFPISKDDGTSTATIDHGDPNWGDGQFALAHNELDADPTVYTDAIGFVDTGYAQWLLDAQGVGEGRIVIDGGDGGGGDGFATVELNVDDGGGGSAEIELYVEEGAANRITFTAGENLWVGPNAAAADASLFAGWFSFWLDDTNGAAKLMVKAKSADGTVVTGSVNLA